MKSIQLSAKTFVALALVVVVLGSAPVAEAKFNWRAALGVLSTVVGVGVGVSGNPAVGVALIGLQGSLLTSDAATEGTGAASSDATPSILELPGPVTTEPARQALIREYPLLDLTGDTSVDYFLQATNDVFESVNVLVRSRLNGAPAAQLEADLRAYGVALERAAEEYDNMGLNHTIDQSDVDFFQYDSAANGLPQAERDFLDRMGFNEQEVAAFTELVSTAPVHLVGTVTPSDVLRAAAAQIAAAQ